MVIMDFNKMQYPSQHADTVFCSGCLEYIEYVDWFIECMCQSAEKEVIVSYCTLEYECDICKRRRRGWKNHMTIRQLVHKFELHGFAIEYGRKSIGCNMIFKFINERNKIVSKVLDNHLTYLERQALNELMDAAARAEQLDGIMIEAGCALGGSGICIASEKQTDKRLEIYDVFGMIPKPGKKDGKDVWKRYQIIKKGQSPGIGGNKYYGYEEDLRGLVEKNFCRILNLESLSEQNIFLIQGLFENVLKCSTPVAFAHIDCDWYDSVMVCLQRIVPWLVKGGELIIDDYYHWSGSRDAVDEYFKDKKEDFLFERKSRLHIKKK